MNILISGATGNVGIELIKILAKSGPGVQIFAAVRNIEKAKLLFAGLESLQYKEFNYENPASFHSALQGIDIVFLLRPPHISNIDKYYIPLFESIRKNNIHKVVLLSVQGADSSEIIPHRKIELLILILVDPTPIHSTSPTHPAPS